MEELAAGLRELRRRAGNPGYRELAVRAGYSAASLANAAGGRQLPSLMVTLAFVRACDGDTAEWERRWRHAATEKARSSEAAATDQRQSSEKSPYQGLAAYGVEDSSLFFGRQRVVAQLVSSCGDKRFVALFGVSGSGKSSILSAGLIPALSSDRSQCADHEKGIHPLEGPCFFPALITPGSRPMENLRLALDRVPPGREVLLVVDQFEELFTLCTDGEERVRFVAALAEHAREPGARTRVVIGVRADFYAYCIELRGLAPLLADASVPVETLSEDELREVITEPARRVGLSVERALVTKIMAEAAGQPGALPLVSHALLETWRQRRGTVLTAAGYEAAGGVSGAISQTAEAWYQALTVEQQNSVREIMVRLVTLGEEGVKDTRRRVDRAELDFPSSDEILRGLADARLVVLGRSTVEIAHETLIEAWPRLRHWLAEDREVLRRHRQLTEDSRIWSAHRRDPDTLYRGARLAAWDGQAIDRLNSLENEFLTASRERQALETRSRQRRTRLALISMAVGVTVMSLITVLAFREANRANDERERALSHQLVANARDQLQVDQELALLLARAAYDTKPTAEAAAVLRQAVIDSRMRARVVSGQQQVFGVAYSPDGRRVASSGADGTVRVWTMRGSDEFAGEPRVLRDHTGYVRIPVFSADSRYLVASGVDGVVTVWDLTTDMSPIVLRGHGGEVSAVAFSPDGRLVAGAGDDGTVRVWDRTNGSPQPVRVLSLDGGPARAVAFSPDGVHLAAAGDAPVKVWNLATTAPPAVLSGHENTVWNVAYSPDGRLLASASADQTVRIWPTTGSEPPLVLRADDGTVETVAFSPDGRRIASGHSGSDTIRVWNTTKGDGEDPMLLHGHHGPVWSVAFSPDGRRLLSGSGDGTLRLWDPTYPGNPQVLDGHSGAAWSVAVSADGNTIASGGADHTVRVWRGKMRQDPLVLTGHGNEVLSVTLTADGSRVASASRDRTVRVWDTNTGAPIAVLHGNTKTVWSVAFSPDGRRVASGGADETVRIWDIHGMGAPIELEGHEASIRGIAFSPDSTQIASTSQDTTVRIWNANGHGDPLVLTGSPGLVWTATFSPDGRTIATGGGDGNIRIWHTNRKEQPRIFRGHRGPVWSVAFRADGQQLVSAGHDSSERIWDTTTGEELLALRGHGAFVEEARFGPDETLVTAHGDGTIRLTRCEACGPINQVRAIADARVTRPLNADERRIYLHEPGLT
ncbi:nSTAND1 domain-containing NTPase [Kibdelosporangium aridum]|uniref:nSTAND1 domain-containing NTPase n=1 Tax=Kibdelosporangium aridum TaxID=2030 RepID=UPI00117BBEF8|nr:helix-turn-helix domain-containing protein [Kibdelosporangium aridum]